MSPRSKQRRNAVPGPAPIAPRSEQARRPNALFDLKNRFVSPFKLVESAKPFIRDLAQLLEAVGVWTADSRWAEQAKRFADARAPLEREDELYERLRKQELAEQANAPPATPPPRRRHIALSRLPQAWANWPSGLHRERRAITKFVRSMIERRLPRKGQARCDPKR